MKTRRAVILGTIFFLIAFWLSLALWSFNYNTQRFIDNPDLLGAPTVYITTHTPVFKISTPAPLNFDSGLGNPLAVGTTTYELQEDDGSGS